MLAITMIGSLAILNYCTAHTVKTPKYENKNIKTESYC